MHQTGDRRIRRTAAWLFASSLALTVLASNASAQQPGTPAQPPAAAPSPAEKPPVAIDGWLYEKRVIEGAIFHQFFCRKLGCGRHPAVSYRIYPPSPPMTMEKFRENQTTILAGLRKQAAPGTQITQLDITGEGSGRIPQWFAVRRLTASPNSPRSYRVSSTLLGRAYSATLISTSQDEQAAIDNHKAFFDALQIFINGPVRRFAMSRQP
jgi:hypothetical protein